MQSIQLGEDLDLTLHRTRRTVLRTVGGGNTPAKTLRLPTSTQVMLCTLSHQNRVLNYKDMSNV